MTLLGVGVGWGEGVKMGERERQAGRNYGKGGAVGRTRP